MDVSKTGIRDGEYIINENNDIYRVRGFFPPNYNLCISEDLDLYSNIDFFRDMKKEDIHNYLKTYSSHYIFLNDVELILLGEDKTKINTKKCDKNINFFVSKRWKLVNKINIDRCKDYFDMYTNTFVEDSDHKKCYKFKYINIYIEPSKITDKLENVYQEKAMEIISDYNLEKCLDIMKNIILTKCIDICIDGYVMNYKDFCPALLTKVLNIKYLKNYSSIYCFLTELLNVCIDNSFIHSKDMRTIIFCLLILERDRNFSFCEKMQKILKDIFCYVVRTDKKFKTDEDKKDKETARIFKKLLYKNSKIAKLLDDGYSFEIVKPKRLKKLKI